MHKINTTEKTTFKTGRNVTLNESWIEHEDFNPNIEIGYGVNLTNCKITVQKGAKLIIRDLSEIRGRIILGEDCTLEIGYGLVCNDAIFIQVAEKGTITISDDCLFANPKIYNSDQHSIFSRDSGKRINRAKDVKIGSRVWLARETLVLKGAQIGNGSILGANSLFSGQDTGCNLLAGSPAKIIKENVLWSRNLTDELSTLLPDDFPSAKFRSNALQFNNDEVIRLGLSIWRRREEIKKVDYYAIYYLARSLLLSVFTPGVSESVSINNTIVNLRDVYSSLLACFELSEKKNIPCGCYAYLAANRMGDHNAASVLYDHIKPLSNQIDNVIYKN